MQTENNFDFVHADVNEVLVEGLLRGDPQAANELVTRWHPSLTAIAGRNLRGPARGKNEPQDIVQSAFRSFFGGVNKQQYQLHDSRELWALLVVITLRKCRKQHRHWTAQRRKEDFEEWNPREERECPGSPPELLVSLNELVERVLSELDPSEGAIIQKSLEGYSATDIAEDLGRSLRTVQRVRRKVCEVLRGYLSYE